jgi:hypothetical protein
LTRKALSRYFLDKPVPSAFPLTDCGHAVGNLSVFQWTLVDNIIRPSSSRWCGTKGMPEQNEIAVVQCVLKAADR